MGSNMHKGIRYSPKPTYGYHISQRQIFTAKFKALNAPSTSGKCLFTSKDKYSDYDCIMFSARHSRCFAGNYSRSSCVRRSIDVQTMRVTRMPYRLLQHLWMCCCWLRLAISSMLRAHSKRRLWSVDCFYQCHSLSSPAMLWVYKLIHKPDTTFLKKNPIAHVWYLKLQYVPKQGK